MLTHVRFTGGSGTWGGLALLLPLGALAWGGVCAGRVTAGQDGHAAAAAPGHAVAASAPMAAGKAPGAAGQVRRVVKAQVIALDQPFLWNRLGSSMPGGMIYALRSDVVPTEAPKKSGPPEPRTVTIEAHVDTTVPGTPRFFWQPAEPSVREGDIVEWRVGNGKHGAMFLDFAKAQDVLEVLPGGLTIGPQPGFDPPFRGTPGSDVAGQLLVRAQVKAIPAGMTDVPFECTIHKTAMMGKLVLDTNPPVTVTIRGIFDANANPVVRWEPATPIVQEGDIVEWRVEAGKHGAMFLDFAAAEKVLEFLPGGLTIGPQPGFDPPFRGTPGSDVAGQVLVRARVKAIPAGTFRVDFECTIHKVAMQGQLILKADDTVVIEGGLDKASSTLRWIPSALSLRPGDIVEWRVGNVPANAQIHHGVTFLDFPRAGQVLEVLGGEPLKPQPGLGPQARGTDGFGDQGRLLLRARVRANPPPGTNDVPYECTIHKARMVGKLTIDTLQPGKVRLRSDRRPRPLVLRANVGDLLEVHFTNLLDPRPVNGSGQTRYAGVHPAGLELVGSIDSDGSWVGTNPGTTGSLAAPGESKVYRFFASQEGTFLFSNYADTVLQSDPNSPSVRYGMFGAINVQPFGAEWYRSQVTRRDLTLTNYKVEKLDTANPEIEDPGIRLRKLDQGSLSPGESSKLTEQVRSRFPGLPREEPTIYEYEKMDPERRTPVLARAIVQGGRLYNVSGHPIVNYTALYPEGSTYPDGTAIAAGTPILQMLRLDRGGLLFAKDLGAGSFDKEMRDLEGGIITPALRQLFEDNRLGLSNQATLFSIEGYAWVIVDRDRSYLVEGLVDEKTEEKSVAVSDAALELVHSDPTAIITGPNAGRFPYNYESPTFAPNPAYPDRRQPYREFTIVYHQANKAIQAFPQYFNKNLTTALDAGDDNFAINYGMAGIGSEILANRLGVGPMGNADAADLKYEEFFLSAWSCGDPAMVVDVPANADNHAVNATDNDPKVREVPQFRFDANKSTFDDLDAGKVPPALLDAFKKNGITVTAKETRVTDLGGRPAAGPWLLTTPNDPDKVPQPDRKRYWLKRAGTALVVSEGVSSDRQSIEGFNAPSKERATRAFYPDDPSNVYHGYIRDHTKFRILHAGPGPSHVHHLHAHQWLHSPNSTDSHYLDSQLISPGSTYTLEITYNGAGNRNQTVGDSIFHCHFYPHFAQGMWSLWRTHDVFEAGTELDQDGRPKAKARALPDGEIERGTPIPAVVPMPTLAMAPIPARVELTDLDPFQPGQGQGRRAKVLAENEEDIERAKKDGAAPPDRVYRNPGYPFFIPGVAGHRAPQPPLDFGWREDENGRAVDGDGKPIREESNPLRGIEAVDADSFRITPKALEPSHDPKVYLDGGLGRHLLLDGKVVREFHTRWDFSKDWILRDKDGKATDGGLTAIRLPEEGTLIERVAMRTHSIRTRPSPLPNGDLGSYILNGLKPAPGAPYASPGVSDDGNPVGVPRKYKAAVIQTDVVLNKKGWHYPQQRLLSLWDDVGPVLNGSRAPEPLFFRATTGDSIQFWHLNLVPAYYELDDYQVRTPTDVIGQHIHLVKFDVTSSDGAANGYNYEDGTYSPDEVHDRIDAVMLRGGMYPSDPVTGFYTKGGEQEALKVHAFKDDYPKTLADCAPGDGRWDGAQTTIQRWDTDPLLNNRGRDRTLRTVFTHDHFSPSTHQQVGLYAGLLVEPEKAEWHLADGTPMNTRPDGGPTSWEGYIVTGNQDDYAENSFREFILEFQDFQLAYTKQSRKERSNENFDPRKVPGASALFDVAQAFDPGVIKDAVAALDTGGVSAALSSKVFPTFGIPLSRKATVAVTEKGAAWVVTEPDELPGGANEGNEGVSYVVQTFKAGTPKPPGDPTHLFVFTPDIERSWSDPNEAIEAPTDGNNTGNGPPFSQLVSNNANAGTYSLNYRNEPVPYRLEEGTPTPPNAADMAYVFRSITRADADLNRQPVGTVPGFDRPFPPLLSPGMQPTDPFTPLLRAYENDHVQVRTLVGGFMQPHDFSIMGQRWQSEPSYPGSGYRNAQRMGISEHFEMLFHMPPATTTPDQDSTDYLYMANSATVGPQRGIWGLLRSYDKIQGSLRPLPNNPAGRAPLKINYEDGFRFAPAQHKRVFNITAITVAQALKGQVGPDGKPLATLVYNGRDPNRMINDPHAIFFVRSEDLTSNDASGRLRPGVFDPMFLEPLVLRAAAGDWIQVNLTNAMPSNAPVFAAANRVRVDNLDLLNQIQRGVSTQDQAPRAAPAVTPTGGTTLNKDFKVPIRVGLQPQLISYDAGVANGVNVGFNPDTTVAPGETRTFYWYAGILGVAERSKVLQTPVEFGTTNLGPADTQTQHQHGLYGVLVVEPEGATWTEDSRPLEGGLTGTTRTSATVTTRDGHSFREFVIMLHNDVAALKGGSALAQPFGSVNYRSEPLTSRNLSPAPPLGYSRFFSNQQVGGDPLTPVFQARAGMPVRFRVSMPGGGALSVIPAWQLAGHVWQEYPFTEGGTELGHNRTSESRGVREVAPFESYNVLLPSAGGAHSVPGDYLWNTYLWEPRMGMWGLLRVTP